MEQQKAARLISEDGTITNIKPANGINFSLQELYKLIDCELVEVKAVKNIRVSFKPAPGYIIMDEEGKLRGKALNAMATQLYGNPNDFIVGKVVVCSKSMFK